MKRKTSIVKCKVANKNNRKTRSLASKSKSSDQDNYVVLDKKGDTNLKTVSKSNKANSLIETKPTVDVKRRTSSVDNMKTTRESKDIIRYVLVHKKCLKKIFNKIINCVYLILIYCYSSTRSRPPRRTKEAATLFMEMLRKDMRCPDEQEEDDTSSVESFPDLPNTRINGKLLYLTCFQISLLLCIVYTFIVFK